MTNVPNTTINWEAINQVIYDDIEKVSAYFGFDLRQDGGYLKGCCPLHDDADNPNAFVIFPNCSYWCFTRCPERSSYTLTSLLQLLLKKKFNDDFSITDALGWYANNISKINLQNLPTSRRKEKTRYIPKILFADVKEWNECYGTEPSPSYIKMGFDPDIVAKFNIRDCHDRTSRMYNRIVVPQMARQFGVVGITGRSLYQVCGKCGGYHSPHAPCITSGFGAKWLHSSGFRTGYHLFGDWFIPRGIREINVVESVGNTLRMIEAGYRNTVGLFGTTLKTGQADILKWLGIRRINLIIDNDEKNAGLIGASKTIKKFSGRGYKFQFRIIVPKVNDVAMMTAKDLKQFLKQAKVFPCL